MCLVLFALESHPRYRLVVAANRDEFHDRPAAPASFWPGAPGVLAGRDLQAGGTWMGVTRTGRFAALTNVREPSRRRTGTPTRGRLVSRFLEGGESTAEFLAALGSEAPLYNGFNLFLGDGDTFGWFESVHGESRILAPGLYGLSNHMLDTPWPKVARTKAALAGWLERPDIPPGALLTLLEDRSRAADELLPDTGIGLEWERLLSAPFIVSPTYGTRCSTVLLLDREGSVAYVERSFDPGGNVSGTVEERFSLSRP